MIRGHVGSRSLARDICATIKDCYTTKTSETRSKHSGGSSRTDLVFNLVLTAQSGPFSNVHLYSGRRRRSDFHYWMGPIQGCIHILSLDAVVDATMNVHDVVLWQRLLDIARSGRLLGLRLGPPCKTWSSACFQPCLA